MKRLVVVTGSLFGTQVDIEQIIHEPSQRRRDLIFVTDYRDLDRVRGLEKFQFIFYGKWLRDETRIRAELLALRATEIATLEEGLKWLAE